MHISHSIILGLIQGLTEFLPISSSGHLIILPYLFGWGKHPLGFDIILHTGTLFAIIIYFRREWIDILRFRGPFEKKLLWYILIASIPAIIFGGVMEESIEHYFRNPAAVASMLGVFGLILYLSESYGRKNKVLQDMTSMAALLIGFSQMFAVVPGVSRSGITISAALLLGMNRESSVRFSFLLGAPIIFAAACYSLKDTGEITGILSWPVALTGFLISFISSIIAIHFLLKFVKKYPLTVFAVYRLVFSLVIVIFLFRG